MNADIAKAIRRKTKAGIHICFYDVIFCVKYRRKVLVGNIEKTLMKILKEEKRGYEIIAFKIHPDYVELKILCEPEVGIGNAIANIKTITAKQLKAKYPELKKRLPCLWTRKRYVSTIQDNEGKQQFLTEQF